MKVWKYESMKVWKYESMQVWHDFGHSEFEPLIPIDELTDFSLPIENRDEDDEEHLTDVTLVSDDSYWRHDLCYLQA